jgi:hypothetical protein
MKNHLNKICIYYYSIKELQLVLEYCISVRFVRYLLFQRQLENAPKFLPNLLNIFYIASSLCFFIIVKLVKYRIKI